MWLAISYNAPFFAIAYHHRFTIKLVDNGSVLELKGFYL